jgi:hypothetical protein
MRKEKNNKEKNNDSVCDYCESIEIRVGKILDGSIYIMAVNSDGESVAFGIEHSLDESFFEQFADKLYKYLENKIKL